MKVLVTQSCPTLCDPMYCSPPGSSVHGILQARILKRVAEQTLGVSEGRGSLACYTVHGITESETQLSN